jgi:hypothetical protein
VALFNFALSQGQILAHMSFAVPEPSALALAGLGVVAICCGVWRRRRQVPGMTG